MYRKALRGALESHITKAHVLEADSLPDELFYQNQAKEDLKPTLVRQWQAYLFRAAGRFDPIFAPWSALAALPPAFTASYPSRNRTVKFLARLRICFPVACTYRRC